MPAGERKVEIPFRFENNFILIDVIFNKVFPLTFIFDTGSENTVLTHKSFADLMDVNYDREYKIMGSDLQKELVVHLVKDIHLDIASMSSSNIPLLVLDENYFQFEKYTGINIHGILGMDLFRLAIIEINYQKRKLILHNPDKFQPPSSDFTKYPVELFRNKIYLKVQGKITATSALPLKLLIDTGANIALLLHNKTDSAITLPPKLIPGKLGDGLGGYLEGYMGRTYQLNIGAYKFTQITTHFQEVPTILDSLHLNNRHGILGNQILSRFTVLLVPYQGEIYLKPSKKYNRKFRYDRSGITAVASGLGLDEFTVLDVLADSPAAEAGLQIGDEILSINFRSRRNLTLNDLTWKFQKRSGKRIRLKVLRNGTTRIIRFRLRDLI